MAIVSESTWAILHSQSPPMIVWKQRGRNFGAFGFTYGALFIQETQTWYLAGDAEFYGSRTCDDQVMLNIIEDPDTETWWYTQQWKKCT